MDSTGQSHRKQPINPSFGSSRAFTRSGDFSDFSHEITSTSNLKPPQPKAKTALEGSKRGTAIGTRNAVNPRPGAPAVSSLGQTAPGGAALSPEEHNLELQAKYVTDKQLQVSNRASRLHEASSLERFKPLSASSIGGIAYRLSQLSMLRSLGGAITTAGGILLFVAPPVGFGVILAGLSLAAVGTLAKLALEVAKNKNTPTPSPFHIVILETLTSSTTEFMRGLSGAVLTAGIAGGICLLLTPFSVPVILGLAGVAGADGILDTYLLGAAEHRQFTNHLEKHAKKIQTDQITATFSPLAKLYKGDLEKRKVEGLEDNSFRYTVEVKSPQPKARDITSTAYEAVTRDDWELIKKEHTLIIDEALLDKAELFMKKSGLSSPSPTDNNQPFDIKTHAWFFDLLALDEEFRDQFTKLDFSALGPSSLEFSNLRNKARTIIQAHWQFEDSNPYNVDASNIEAEKYDLEDLTEAIQRKKETTAQELSNKMLVEKGIQEIYNGSWGIQGRNIWGANFFDQGTYYYKLEMNRETSGDAEEQFQLEINSDRLDKIHTIIERACRPAPSSKLEPLFNPNDFNLTEKMPIEMQTEEEESTITEMKDKPVHLDLYLRAFDLFASNQGLLDRLEKIDVLSNDPNEQKNINDLVNDFHQIMSAHTLLQEADQENYKISDEDIQKIPPDLAHQIAKRQKISYYDFYTPSEGSLKKKKRY